MSACMSSHYVALSFTLLDCVFPYSVLEHPSGFDCFRT